MSCNLQRLENSGNKDEISNWGSPDPGARGDHRPKKRRVLLRIFQKYYQ